MTAEERNAIKSVLDAYARRLFILDGRHLNRCGECGGENIGWTLGCKACAQRHHAKVKRGTHPDLAWYNERALMALAHSAMLKTERQREVMKGNRNRRGGRGKKPVVPGRRSYA